jgi:6-phosphogluconolactonase (cycloisomerase 2 family)
MFKYAALLAFVSLAISVSAAPLEIRAGNGSAIANVKSSVINKNSKQKAAAYFITNEDTGNFIVAMDIDTNDGKLKLARAISTGGVGDHGKSNGPDALFSQGSIKASSNGEFLVAVNAGSNTVSLFSIDKKNPSTLKLVGGPTSSEGEFPVSVAIHPANDVVCVLNGGRINNVQCFSINKKKGLKALDGTHRSLKLKDLTTSPKGPEKTVSHILFSEKGDTLLASIKGDGGKNPGFVAAWEVKDKKLSKEFKKVTVPDGGNLPFGMAVIPDKNAILATDPAAGFEVLDLSSVSGNAKKFEGKSNVVKIDGQKAVCWAAHSKKTGNFYLSDIGTSKVTEVNIDGNSLKGKVVKQVDLKSDSSLVDIDIASFNNNKDFIYVLAAGALAVDVLEINGSGDFKSIQTLDIAEPAKKAKLNINKNNVMGMTTVVINQ